MKRIVVLISILLMCANQIGIAQQSTLSKAEISLDGPGFMRLSPDKKYFATVAKSEKIAKVKVYDVFTGILIREYSYPSIIALEFSPDSKYLATLCVEDLNSDVGSLIFSNIASGEQINFLKLKDNFSLKSFAFHPNGKIISFYIYDHIGIRRNTGKVGKLVFFDIESRKILVDTLITPWVQGGIISVREIQKQERVGNFRMSYNNNGKFLTVWFEQEGQIGIPGNEVTIPVKIFSISGYENSRGQTFNITRIQLAHNEKTYSTVRALVAGGNGAFILSILNGLDLVIDKSTMSLASGKYLFRLEKDDTFSVTSIGEFKPGTIPLSISSDSVMVYYNNTIEAISFQSLKDGNRSQLIQTQQSAINCLQTFTDEVITNHRQKITELKNADSDIMVIEALTGGIFKIKTPPSLKCLGFSYDTYSHSSHSAAEIELENLNEIFDLYRTAWKKADTLGVGIIEKADIIQKKLMLDLSQFEKEYKLLSAKLKKSKMEVDRINQQSEKEQQVKKQKLKPGDKTSKGIVVQRKGNAALIQPNDGTSSDAKWYNLDQFIVY